jgi:serine/threonine-protein kinase
MTAPSLTAEQASRAVPSAKDVVYIERGGQKAVFSCLLQGRRFVLKFMYRDDSEAEEAGRSVQGGVTRARARRELEAMTRCDSPYLVKVGPIGLKDCDVDGLKLLFYTEEHIAGTNLREYLRLKGPLPLQELVLLGSQIAQAVEAIWNLHMIHRDIKPGNIIRKHAGGNFVLLDMGCLFDLSGESYSGFPLGTLPYFSPEQLDFAHRRSVLDFRSDLHALGIVLYEMATGVHPFMTSTVSSQEALIDNILHRIPPALKQLRHNIPSDLDRVIMQLLAKQPALRFRKVSMLLEALNNIKSGG